MVLKKVRIGALTDVFQYDDGDFDSGIETTETIKAGTPSDPSDVLRLSDVGTLTGNMYGPAGSTDSNIAEFDGVTGKTLKDGGLTHANVSDAISKKHTQGTDTALGAVGTKNPPIDADKVIYRDSTSSDALVTSTWTQVKAFLKTYFDTLYSTYSSKVFLTPDGGVAVKLTNKTGGNSVKGEVVTPYTSANNAVAKIVVDVPDPIGVFYESGVADGSEAWVVVAGIADVYFVGNTTRGHIARGFLTADGVSYVTGQAMSEAVPGSPFSVDKHFYEIGHVLETRVGAGLAKCVLHFN